MPTALLLGLQPIKGGYVSEQIKKGLEGLEQPGGDGIEVVSDGIGGAGVGLTAGGGLESEGCRWPVEERGRCGVLKGSRVQPSQWAELGRWGFWLAAFWAAQVRLYS